MREPLRILVAEDDSNDALLLKLAFAETGVNAPMYFVRDGEEAIDYLRGVMPFDNRAEHPFPNVLVLDLKMPRVDGFEVLRWLRQQTCLDQLTVVVLSGSCWQADIDCAYALGANFCLHKPVGFQELVGVVEQVEANCSPPLISNRTISCLSRI